MPDRDILLAKASAIQRCLKRIRDVTKLDPGTLDDQNTQDIFVLNLQRAIQAAIDLAAHIISTEGLGLPDTVKDNFILLEKAKIIHKASSKLMQAMVGFRNIAIHQYQTLDIRILKSILTKNLRDLETFYAETLLHFKVVPRKRRNKKQ